MKPVSEISHEATVKSVDNDTVTVLLSPNISCSGCQSKSLCGISENSEKIIRVNGSFDLHPGEKVEILMKGSQGYTALFFGYILPLLLVILTLTTLTLLHSGELVSGIAAFAVLIPYYIILWLFRNSLGKKFSFTLKTTA